MSTQQHTVFPVHARSKPLRDKSPQKKKKVKKKKKEVPRTAISKKSVELELTKLTKISKRMDLDKQIFNNNFINLKLNNNNNIKS